VEIEEQGAIGASASPPTVRVLDVIELLAERNGEPIRFSDLARRLQLSQGTTHAILATLCDRGWAQRDRLTKSYAIGPALPRAARKVSRDVSLLDTALEGAAALAADVGFPASVIERTGDELQIVGLAGDLDRLTGVTTGDRVPFAAPFGPAFAAWLDPDERQTWFQRTVGEDARLQRRLEGELAATRERGYSLERTPMPHLRAVQVMTTLRREPASPGVRQAIGNLLGEITASGLLPPPHAVEREPVTSLAAPLFDAGGTIALNLALHPFRPLTRREIEAAGRALVQAAVVAGQEAA
jgi:DNA-binding IclR family transcriptional regulator